jgi:cytochrome b561
MKKSADNVTRALHWLSAFFILSMLSVGYYMTNAAYDSDTYYWHKSIGVLVFIIVAIRFVWRIKSPWVSSVNGSKLQIWVKWVHNLMFLLFALMPLSGFLSSAFSGYGVSLFQLVIIPQNLNEVGEITAINKSIYLFCKTTHAYVSYVLSSFICIHILAALKHHFVDKDNTLVRMLKG